MNANKIDATAPTVTLMPISDVLVPPRKQNFAVEINIVVATPPPDSYHAPNTEHPEILQDLLYNLSSTYVSYSC